MSHKVPFVKLLTETFWFSKSMHVFALFLILNHPAEGLQQKQNKGFVPTPQGSHTVTPSQTDDELDDLPDVESINPKRPRRRPSRTEEIKGKYKSLWKLKFKMVLSTRTMYSGRPILSNDNFFVMAAFARSFLFKIFSKICRIVVSLNSFYFWPKG